MAVRLLLLALVAAVSFCGRAPIEPVESFSCGYGYPPPDGTSYQIDCDATTGNVVLTRRHWSNVDGNVSVDTNVVHAVLPDAKRDELRNVAKRLDVRALQERYGWSSATDGLAIQMQLKTASQSRSVIVDTYDFDTLPEELAYLYRFCKSRSSTDLSVMDSKSRCNASPFK